MEDNENANNPEIAALTEQIKILTDQLKALKPNENTEEHDYFLDYIKECKFFNGSK